MFSAHASVAAQLQAQQSAAGLLAYGDCLLLLALRDALSRLSAQAFIRQDVAQTIAAVAQQELIAALVRSAPSLPSICLTGRLLLYRYRQQHWLLILKSVHAACLPPMTLTSMSSGAPPSTAGDAPATARQRAEVVMAYLRRFLPRDRKEGKRVVQSAVVKYNLPGFEGTAARRRVAPETASDERETEDSASGEASEPTQAKPGAAPQPSVPRSACASESLVAAPPSSVSAVASPTAPALEGAVYFVHEGVLRASVPNRHQPQINNVISAALSATGGGGAQPSENKKRRS
ncbi:hypothetical protein BESB_074720 [Besnoitia besnoiti]|uniref:Uncharacterized protein n=1 Tax=Besnoitia besnoiti TaxID=94643 RepID=A0A2A9MG13_BESBE|nr:uncharacterized protein BESB_074720 [Besnoitia besnoiti]PFH34320.1 hypothetical protein BESB_074720 [Besnoitia besnoiti]